MPGVGDMGVGVDIRDKYEEDGCSSAVGKRDKNESHTRIRWP